VRSDDTNISDRNTVSLVLSLKAIQLTLKYQEEKKISVVEADRL